MKTVVSSTPIAVQRDSRTFKVAASIARLGHRSIVVEGEPSQSLSGPLPFELITIGGRPEPSVAENDAPPADPGAATDPGAVMAHDIEAVAHAAEYRGPITRGLDDFAAGAPSWLRRVAGPPWRELLRRRRQLKYFLSRPHRRPLPRIAQQPFMFYAHLRYYLSTCWMAASALPEADLYYLHSPRQFLAVWWRSRLGRKPFVYDAHDLYWTLRRDGRPLPAADRAIWVVWDAVERVCAARARACVTVGDGVAWRAEERFGRRFAVVRNAHDDRLDENGIPDLRARLDLPDDALLLAVSGNFKRGMAVEPMLKALSLLPERVHVAFLGAGYEDFPASAAEMGVADHAHFLDPVEPTQIVPVLAGADLAPVLYYPSSISIRHALPNGFFHAIAAGVPVLYSRHLVDLRRLCAHNELGWEIDPESETSIAVTVGRLVDAAEELARRRAHVRAVRDRLSWEHEERELARVVTAALDGRVG